MGKKKIVREQAQAEFDKWLEFKRISERRREGLLNFEEKLVDAICDGYMSVTPELELKYKLSEPIKDEDGVIKLDELVFKPRIRDIDVQKALKGVKDDDGNGRLRAIASACTGVPKGLIGLVWDYDMNIYQAIAVYFVTNEDDKLITLDLAVKTVRRLYKNSLEEIDNMYFDDIDYHGLFYWYFDAEVHVKQIENSAGALK